ncbi:MAG: GNAT family N-acetyltransferase [Acidobacteriota bacterium]|nr:GNAT family N-acetyltransferase [Acidobacteriota bacterium]
MIRLAWEVRQVQALDPEGLRTLIRESRGEGFRFLARLTDDWRTGANRFDKPGEVLYVVADGAAVVAVGGLNIDPYRGDPRLGRLRHLYVLRSARRKGLGTMLVRRILAHASSVSFDTVRLRTDNPGAASFYEAMGFRRCPDSASATHELAL